MYLIKVYNFYLNFFFSNWHICKEIHGKIFGHIHFIACITSVNAADLYLQCIKAH